MCKESVGVCSSVTAHDLLGWFGKMGVEGSDLGRLCEGFGKYNGWDNEQERCNKFISKPEGGLILVFLLSENVKCAWCDL